MLHVLLALAVAASDSGLRLSPPGAVGMSADRLATIDRVIARGIESGGFPGAAVVVGRRGYAVWEKGYGGLDWTGNGRRVDAGTTIYDLASLTKVIATSTAIMVLYDGGKLALDDPVAKYLPAFTGGLKPQVTIRHLLTHRSGLPEGRDLWRIAHTPAEARRAVLATPLDQAPGVRHVYSDIGADVLAMVAEAVAGEPLDRFLTRRVYRPLGMLHTGFRPAASLRSQIAPTELRPPRGRPLQGEVHDENAYALGGVAGHAGLFSTAADLAVFAQMMLNGGEYNGTRIISDSTVALFTRRAGGWRALGWDTCAGGASCGQHMSERAFGHTGYTGTSIWIDPDRQSFVILLTNWVHARPTGSCGPFTILADVRGDVADAASLSVLDDPAGVPVMPPSFRADRAVGWR